MPADAGAPIVTPDATADRRSSPIVEVELSAARPAQAVSGRLNLAWLLFGAFGLTTLLAIATSGPRSGATSVAGVIVPMYLTTVGTLVWVAFETGRATRRG